MKQILQYDCKDINWEELTTVIEQAGLSVHPPQVFQQAFESSTYVVFLKDGDRLIGCARSLSDLTFQTAIYDVALLPDYQGMGLGGTLLKELMKQSPDCNFILYASPGKESFYQHYGFSRLTTGMGFFTNAQRMRDRGMLE